MSFRAFNMFTIYVISCLFLLMSFRAVGVSRIRAANSREISLIGNNAASSKEISPRAFWVAYLMSGALVTSAFARDRIHQREAVRAMEITFFNQRYFNCVGARIARPRAAYRRCQLADYGAA